MVVIDGVEVDLQNLETKHETLVCGHENCGIGYYQENGIWYANVCYGISIVQLEDYEFEELRSKAERLLLKLSSGWFNSL